MPADTRNEAEKILDYAVKGLEIVDALAKMGRPVVQEIADLINNLIGMKGGKVPTPAQWDAQQALKDSLQGDLHKPI